MGADVTSYFVLGVSVQVREVWTPTGEVPICGTAGCPAAQPGARFCSQCGKALKKSGETRVFLSCGDVDLTSLLRVALDLSPGTEGIPVSMYRDAMDDYYEGFPILTGIELGHYTCGFSDQVDEFVLGACFGATRETCSTFSNQGTGYMTWTRETWRPFAQEHGLPEDPDLFSFYLWS